MRLEAASLTPPRGLAELIDDLGGGENGFMGSPVHDEGATLDEYLRRCAEMTDPARLPPDRVPMTTCWALDDDGLAVGIVRMRHVLNEALRVHGGHLGYHVKKDQRGRGHGRQMLRLVLDELRAVGVDRAFVTTDADNLPSIRILQSVNAELTVESDHPRTGVPFRGYWVDAIPQGSPRRPA